jgi:predicted nucleic acid-binding Zn ribbon protein
MKRCVICARPLPEKSRSDRRTCSARCRVALSRRLARAAACAALNVYLAAADGDAEQEAWRAYVKAAAKEAR